jgi:radical SAM superfamily enzyme YgiQ (UPF0313 family)
MAPTLITLVNTNRMSPPIAPIGLDYLAGAARSAGIEVEVLDLGLAGDPPGAMREYFQSRRPELVGLSFRNVDDSFWPSAAWFVPPLRDIMADVRALTDAPVALGGSGFSIFPERIVQETKADFGVRGDGEQAMVRLVQELRGRRRFEQVPGLLWRAEERTVLNELVAEAAVPKVHAARDAVDNATYFRLGGQMGVQTKRGCNRGCIFAPISSQAGACFACAPPATWLTRSRRSTGGGSTCCTCATASSTSPGVTRWPSARRCIGGAWARRSAGTRTWP